MEEESEFLSLIPVHKTSELSGWREQH